MNLLEIDKLLEAFQKKAPAGYFSKFSAPNGSKGILLFDGDDSKSANVAAIHVLPGSHENMTVMLQAGDFTEITDDFETCHKLIKERLPDMSRSFYINRFNL